MSISYSIGGKLVEAIISNVRISKVIWASAKSDDILYFSLYTLLSQHYVLFVKREIIVWMLLQCYMMEKGHIIKCWWTKLSKYLYYCMAWTFFIGYDRIPILLLKKSNALLNFAALVSKERIAKPSVPIISYWVIIYIV